MQTENGDIGHKTRNGERIEPGKAAPRPTPPRTQLKHAPEQHEEGRHSQNPNLVSVQRAMQEAYGFRKKRHAGCRSSNRSRKNRDRRHATAQRMQPDQSGVGDMRPPPGARGALDCVML